MIRLENYLGIIEISHEYFSKLIGNAVSSCFGVAGMANSNARQGLRSVFRKKRSFVDKGVNVYKDGNGLSVDLHIVVTFGLNITAIVKSIVNKVRYVIEEATGLEVRKVNVYVDGMIHD
ncbi:MAG TPA: Asp23/Gls24 family envelope stress response protein [Clostridia bacterium]|nr:Asp23/Gls24 family envelope stress response protein [Clostridia bacterium]